MPNNDIETPSWPTARPASSSSVYSQKHTARHRLSSHSPDGNMKSPSPHASRERLPKLDRRRSSLLSFSSLDDATHSFAEDVLNPGASRGRAHTTDGGVESMHWHSAPLVFAVLPAIGGLVFKNGSAFVTDVLLLGLAAIFLNWSVRLPWEWYYAAQAVEGNASPKEELYGDAIPERIDEDDIALDTSGSSPDELSNGEGTDKELRPLDKKARADAALELQSRERLAFVATFVMPVLAAYGLHLLRSQLSRGPSNLISDYNLTIFLLAALFRPSKQLVKLVSARTLHLQRTAMGAELQKGAQPTAREVASLISKHESLEARFEEYIAAPTGIIAAQKAEFTNLSGEMRKRYEGRVEGLERAVRRYEKRFTTMAMLNEQRLQNVESRLQDALSLAAVAAQSSQRRAFLSGMFGTLGELTAVPFRVAWSIIALPLRLLDSILGSVKLAVGGGPRRKASKGISRASRHRDEVSSQVN